MNLCQYGVREEGAVYPGEEKVKVELSGETVCSRVTTTDTSCTTDTTRDGNYTVSLTLSNDEGSVSAVREFDCEFLSLLYTHNILHRSLSSAAEGGGERGSSSGSDTEPSLWWQCSLHSGAVIWSERGGQWRRVSPSAEYLSHHPPWSLSGPPCQ